MDPLTGITFLDLNVTKNCTLAGKVLAKSYQLDTTPYFDLVELVRYISPDPFNLVSAGKIVDWYRVLPRSEDIFAVNKTIKKDCHKDFCEALGWEGNSDIAGIGVIVSYAIEAILATLFVGAFVYFALFKKKYPGDLSTKTLGDTPLWGAIQASLCIFWDSALIFAVGASIAALIVSIVDNTAYTRLFAALNTVIVTSVLLLLWPFYSPLCKDPQSRKVGLIFDNTIHGSRARNSILIGSFYIMVGMAFESIRFVFGTKKFSASVSLQDRFTTGCGPFLASLWSIVPFIFVWYPYGSFIALRWNVSSLAGNSLQENKWGFGQILAIFTWLPTLLDFISVWKDKKRGLERRLPVGITIQSQEIAGGDQLPLVEPHNGGEYSAVASLEPVLHR